MVQVTDSGSHVATCTVSVGPGVSIAPVAATVAPGGTVVFGASGGSGSGYTWSFVADASGGAIDASTGRYVAGTKGGVTDVIRVADSLGNVTSRDISVTPTAGVDAGTPATGDAGSSADAGPLGNGASNDAGTTGTHDAGSVDGGAPDTTSASGGNSDAGTGGAAASAPGGTVNAQAPSGGASSQGGCGHGAGGVWSLVLLASTVLRRVSVLRRTRTRH